MISLILHPVMEIVKVKKRRVLNDPAFGNDQRRLRRYHVSGCIVQHIQSKVLTDYRRCLLPDAVSGTTHDLSIYHFFCSDYK